MSEYETKLLIDELLKTLVRLKSENESKNFEIVCLNDDVKRLRNEVARLEAQVAEKEAKAS